MICSRLFKWSLRITGDSRGDLWMRPYFHFPFLEFENIFPKRTINKIFIKQSLRTSSQKFPVYPGISVADKRRN